MQMIETYLSNKILDLLEKEYTIEKPLPHVTELIYCLTKSYNDRKTPISPNRKEILLFALGWGLEKLLLSKERKLDVGCIDGIYYSPDFLAVTDIPGELKTTRTNMSKFSLETMPEGWKRQILSYMKCLNTTEYELVVLFILGNWKPPFPEIVSYRVKADMNEIEQNWEWLLQRKEIYMHHISNNIKPAPFTYNFEWECQYCRYSIECTVNKKG